MEEMSGLRKGGTCHYTAFFGSESLLKINMYSGIYNKCGVFGIK